MHPYGLIRTMPGSKTKPGLCYKNAFDFATSNPGWVLVHGVATGTGGEIQGVPFGHAWVERTSRFLERVYDPTADQLVLRALYYHVGRIGRTVRYEVDQALKLALETRHYGPWDDAIATASHEGNSHE